MRWPGKIKAGSVLNGIVSHIDMLPTLLAAAGDPDVTKQKLLNGCKVGDKTFKVHLDGYNMIPYLTGEVKESPRNAIMYFSDDGEVMAVRVGDYKFNAGGSSAPTSMNQSGGAAREASAADDTTTSVATRSSGPTSTRTSTGTGWSITLPRCT